MPLSTPSSGSKEAEVYSLSHLPSPYPPRSVPPLYPVYYPVGPAPVQFGSTGNDDDDAIVSTPTSQGNGKGKGKYKTRGSNNGKWWKDYVPSTANACAGVINPCGGGSCYTQNGMAR